MTATDVLRELICADKADQLAKSEALRRGVIATQPLTAARLQELCALGEAMIRTGRRKAWAMTRAVDLVLERK